MTSSHVTVSTNVQQIKNRKRQPPLKQIRLHVRSGLAHHCSAIGLSVCLHVVCVLVWVCLTVHMCICLGKRSRWTRGHCCKSWEIIWVIQCLLPALPDWGFQFSREAGMKSETQPPPSFSSPLSSLCWDKIRTYADDISLFVVEKKNHMSPLSQVGSECSSQARDHYPVGRGHVSVPWAGTRTPVGAGAAGINPSYGR